MDKLSYKEFINDLVNDIKKDNINNNINDEMIYDEEIKVVNDNLENINLYDDINENDFNMNEIEEDEIEENGIEENEMNDNNDHNNIIVDANDNLEMLKDLVWDFILHCNDKLNNSNLEFVYETFPDDNTGIIVVINKKTYDQIYAIGYSIDVNFIISLSKLNKVYEHNNNYKHLNFNIFKDKLMVIRDSKPELLLNLFKTLIIDLF